ncbi:MAG TPA: choice-of-anchor Q domain-containing protein, partial [Anaerolineae bacterium]|nr:choice-of-anchor Q domain-containing protein [Anaerolineae bacterium]
VNENKTGNGANGGYGCMGGEGLRGGAGGGIANDGTLSLINSTVNDNATGNGGSGYQERGGNGGIGGGIANGGTLSLINSTLSGNTTGFGSSGCCVSSNGGHGGGIYNSNVVSITNSTLSDNATGDGVSPTNPVSTNGGDGGGIYNTNTLSVFDSTLNNNTTGQGINGGSRGRGSAVFLSGSAIFVNTIIAGNSSTENCYDVWPTDGGYNLDSGNTCGFTTINHSLVNTDPLLWVLGNYGGPVQTVPLRGGSPAIDAIPLGDNGCGTTITTDARGVPRPQGAACDIGAFEGYVYLYYYSFPVILR